jgi:16S rRNA (uracil1498-N3)-methyltransferase
MTRRFYVEPGALVGDTVVIDGPLAHRLSSVLRLRPGEAVAFFDGSGEDVTVRLDTVSSKRVASTVLARAPGSPEPRTRIHLYQSVTKGERFDWLVEKATEIGVSRIVPLITARAVVRTAAGGNRVERWRRIAAEAAEQCGRSAVPVVGEPRSYAEAIASIEGVVALLPYEAAGEGAPSVQTALNDRIDELFATGEVSIFVGPEGGFDEAEVRAAVDAGATVVTLGNRILRAETAGLVASVLVMHACGELE